MCFTEANDLKGLISESRAPYLQHALDANVDFGPSPTVESNLKRTVEYERTIFDARHQKRSGGLLGEVEDETFWRNLLALLHTSTALGLHYGQAPQPRGVELYGSVLSKAKSLVEASGGELFLCYLPTRTRFAGLLSPKAAMDVTRQRIIGVAEAAGVRVLDLTDAFASYPRPEELYWVDGTHFSKQGAALAAEVLADGLARARLQSAQGAGVP